VEKLNQDFRVHLLQFFKRCLLRNNFSRICIQSVEYASRMQPFSKIMISVQKYEWQTCQVDSGTFMTKGNTFSRILERFKLHFLYFCRPPRPPSPPPPKKKVFMHWTVWGTKYKSIGGLSSSTPADAKWCYYAVNNQALVCTNRQYLRQNLGVVKWNELFWNA
jgi:hypothetical protein